MVYEGQFILTEEEVAFDAADAIRFGEDIFICLSHVSNTMVLLRYRMCMTLRISRTKSSKPKEMYNDFGDLVISAGQDIYMRII